MAMDLAHLRAVWETVTQRGDERFKVPPDEPPDGDGYGEWPPDYDQQLGIQGDQEMVDDPTRLITVSAYLLQQQAARHLMLVMKASKLFDLDNPRHAREIVARAPELGAGLEICMDVWKWFEQTSGLFVPAAQGELRDKALSLIRILLTNLVWKLKLQARTKELINGTPEPLLSTTKLMAANMDINYNPNWHSHAKSYYKKNINTESATEFSEAVEQERPEMTPYTWAARCAACDTRVIPGRLVDHLKECRVVNPPGYAVPCVCGKAFKNAKAQSAHRVLHCRARDDDAPCKACNELGRCTCIRIREAMCTAITVAIDANKVGSIYDLQQTQVRNLSDPELEEILLFADDWETPEGMETTLRARRESTPAMDVPSNTMTQDRSGAVSREEADDRPHQTTAEFQHEGTVTPPPVRSRSQSPGADNHKCDLCGQTFPTAQRLEAHRRQVHPTYTCTTCGAQFSSEEHLTEHEYEHPPASGMNTTTGSEEGGHTCGTCNRRFLTHAILQTHIQERHQQNTYTCNTCGRQYRTASQLHQHMAAHFKCDICDKPFPTIEQRKSHTRQVHGHQATSTTCSRCGVDCLTNQTLQTHRCGQVQCTACGGYFPDLNALQQHRATQHPVCVECNLAFRSWSDLQNHKDTAHQHTHTSHQHQHDDHNRSRYTCRKCPATFTSAMDLFNHDQAAHASNEADPTMCLSCHMAPARQDYLSHLKTHPNLFRWDLRGVRCPKCPDCPLNSVATTLEHYMSTHPADLPRILLEAKTTLDARTNGNTQEAIPMAIRKCLGGTEGFQCPFQGCGQRYPTSGELTTHKKTHGCKICDFIATSPRNLQTHMTQHNEENKGYFPCSKCGQRLTSIDELTLHQATHKKHKCNKCLERFSSELQANQHEMTCTTIAKADIYSVSANTQPTLVLAQCVQTLMKNTTMEEDVRSLLKDQIDKAISTEAQKTTLRKNYKTQKSYTFLKVPTFGPTNTQTTYTTRDISEMTGKEFSGEGSAEANYLKLMELMQALGRVIQARNITQDIATALLFQFLRPPAKDFADTFREEIEMRHGQTAVPPLEDVVLYLEAHFVAIRPEHAKAQLLALRRSGNESMSDFYIRSWRCSHFASFTAKESDRPKFRVNTVKEVLLRNLTPKNRQIIDEEEYQRTLRNEAAFSPRELVDHLNTLKVERDALDGDKKRPDYTTVGQVSTSLNQLQDNKKKWVPGLRGRQRRDHWDGHPRRSERQPVRQVATGRGGNKQRNPRIPPTQSKIRQVEPTPAVKTEPKEWKKGPPKQPAHPANPGQPNAMAKDKWVSIARKMVGEGCFKCGKIGHGYQECRTYKDMYKYPCRTCNKGYHNTALCKQGNKPNPTRPSAPRSYPQTPNNPTPTHRNPWTKQAIRTTSTQPHHAGAPSPKTNKYQNQNGYQNNRGYQNHKGYQNNRGYQNQKGHQANQTALNKQPSNTKPPIRQVNQKGKPFLKQPPIPKLFPTKDGYPPTRSGRRVVTGEDLVEQFMRSLQH